MPIDPVTGLEEEPVGGTQRQTKQALLESQRDMHNQNAMELLNKSLSNQAEITPSQGFAAALLAAIPTIGGAMMGKAIGRPNIPEGTYFKGMSGQDFNKTFNVSGANAGGLAGAQIGAEQSGDYFKRMDDAIKGQIPVLQKQAGVELDRAESLEDQAQMYDKQELEDQSFRERLPLQAQKEMDVAAFQAEQAKDLHDHKIANPGASSRPPNRYELMSPEQQKGYAEKVSGRDEFGNPTKKAVKISDGITQDLAGIRTGIREATIAAKEMQGFGSWAELQAAQRAAGLDPDAAIARTRNLVSTVIKQISGTAASDKEREKIQAFIMGDLTSGPGQVANYLARFAERERARGETLLETAEQIGDPDARKTFFSNPGDRKSDPAYQRILAEKRKAKGLQ